MRPFREGERGSEQQLDRWGDWIEAYAILPNVGSVTGVRNQGGAELNRGRGRKEKRYRDGALIAEELGMGTQKYLFNQSEVLIFALLSAQLPGNSGIVD